MSIPTSFGAVSFYTRAVSESGFNKQVVLHNVINGSGPYVETLGNGAEIYEFDAFVSYDSGTYLTRDGLRELILKQGTAYLTHPSLGVKYVTIMNVGMSEDAHRKGYIDLRLVFVVNKNSQYKISTSSGSKLASVVSKSTFSGNLSSIGSTALGVLNTGSTIIKSISGSDIMLSGAGQTLGRFYQAGAVASSILNSSTSIGGVIAGVTSARAGVISLLTK